MCVGGVDLCLYVVLLVAGVFVSLLSCLFLFLHVFLVIVVVDVLPLLSVPFYFALFFKL